MRAVALCALTTCAVAAVAACGSAPSGASTSAHARSRPASHLSYSAGHRRTLTVADNGANVRLRPGQAIVVILASPAQMWEPPRVSGVAVRRANSRGGYPVSQVAVASFVAVRSGRATLTSTTNARCLHAQPPCEIAQQLWAVTIIVTKHRPG